MPRRRQHLPAIDNLKTWFPANVTPRDTLLSDLPLNHLSVLSLKRRGWTTVGDICDRSFEEMIQIRYVGPVGVNELREAFEPLGISAFPAPPRLTHVEWQQRPSRLWPAHRPLARAAWVYFIRCDRFIKIGLASDLNKRFNGLQTSTPHRLAIWMAIECAGIAEAGDLEAEMHERFSTHRHRGEWFHLSAPIIAFIRAERRRCRSGAGIAA